MSLVYAAVLGCAALAAWFAAGEAKPHASRYVRLACLLYAALAAAGVVAAVSPPDMAHLVLIVGVLVSALAPPLLAIAVHGSLWRPIFSTWAAAVLVVTCMAGLMAVLTGLAVLALLPQTAAIICIFIFGLRASPPIAWRLCLSALALFAGSLSVVADRLDAGMMFSLFSAAGLLGVTRALLRT